MKKVFVYIVSTIAALCVILTLAFSAMEIVIFNESSYHESYQENELYDFIGVQREQLHEITHEMLSYLKGKREDLIMFADIKGEYQQVFEEREILHMVDVQKLFLGGIRIRNISAVVGLVLIVLLFLLEKKRAIVPLARSYLWTMAAIMGIFITLGILMAIDFSGVFTKFHLLFFDNDLWILNINTDVLIQMLPESFFNKLAIRIVAYLSIFIILPAVLSLGYLLMVRKKNAQQ